MGPKLIFFAGLVAVGSWVRLRRCNADVRRVDYCLRVKSTELYPSTYRREKLMLEHIPTGISILENLRIRPVKMLRLTSNFKKLFPAGSINKIN